MFFLFHADNNVSEFLDTQHRTAPRGLFRFCCERCGSKVFANNQLQLTRPPQAGERAKVLESCKKAAGGRRCALPPKGNVIRQTTKNGFKGARSVCRRLSFSFPFLSWPCLVLQWLWPRMLVVAKPKLCVFLGLLAWFASSVTWQLFFCNLLGTMVFLFHADAFPSEQFFRIF